MSPMHIRPSPALRRSPLRPHEAPFPPCDQPSFFGLLQENNLQHHGWRSHDYVDPHTETKCDSCFAWSEHLILCAEVITQVEGRRNSQNIHRFMMRSSCDDGSNIDRQTRCAVKQVVRLLWKLRVLRETAAFRRTRGNHTQFQRGPSPAAEVLKLQDRYLQTCAVEATNETDNVDAVR